MREADSEAEEIVPVELAADESVPRDAVNSEEESEELESDEDEPLEKPTFSEKLVDVEVIEGSAARMQVAVDGKFVLISFL